MKTSTELQNTLRDMEAQLNASGDTLVLAEDAYRAALRRAVNASDPSLANAAEDAVNQARVAYDRLKAATETARELVTEAKQRERDEIRAAVKAEIEAELAEINEIARELDTQFAAFVGQLVRLNEREIALQKKCSQTFGPAWGGLSILRASRPLASYLNNLAGTGIPSNPTPVMEMASKSAAHSIMEAVSNAD